jgi:hypothetical protein
VSLTDPEIEPVVACGDAGASSKANTGSAKAILRFISDLLPQYSAATISEVTDQVNRSNARNYDDFVPIDG